MRSLRPLALIACVGFAASALPAVDESSSYRQQIEEWRATRIAALTSDEGWLTLIGLYWLEAGRNAIGSGEGATVRLPADKAPEEVGEILLAAGEARLAVRPGVGLLHEGEAADGLLLASDATGSPTRLELGDLLFYLIDRDGRLGVRVKDRGHPARTDFIGIESYPVDPRWRIEARFEPYDPPKKLAIPTVLGTVSEQTSSGALVFDLGGTTHRLDVLAEPGDETLFIIFSDQTSNRETYGGGRYLTAGAADAAGGRVILDFNKAYNPPCAFTAYATCPLPPRQNRLQVAVEAGEKRYTGLVAGH